MMTSTQKETFYSNFDFFLKKFGLKKTDLEKDAGVSQGYLSRFLQKDDPDAFPSVSFLEFCSRKFGVPMDDLINVKFVDMTSTEENIYKFIRKLIEDSRNDDLIWTENTTSKITEQIQESPLKEWDDFVLEKRKGVIPAEDGPITRLVFKPAKDLNGDGTINDSQFCTYIDSGVKVFFLPIPSWNAQTQKNDIEYTLWMRTEYENYSSEQQCIARGNETVFTALLPTLKELYTTILERKKHIQIDQSFKNIINSYLNPKPKSYLYQQGNSYQQTDDDDGLPF